MAKTTETPNEAPLPHRPARAGTGPKADQTRSKRAELIRALKFKPFEKGTLRGFADLELSRVGLIVRGATLHRKGDREWIGLPACRWQSEDGTVQWTPALEFVEGATAAWKAFREQALAALHAFLAETAA